MLFAELNTPGPTAQFSDAAGNRTADSRPYSQIIVSTGNEVGFRVCP